ncbi:MAG: ABC transporter ATP-binding protein [Chloroflexota bacterium]|nr:MAG: ABC transporter ATP-binding protein [Chloroflexota bacterium]
MFLQLEDVHKSFAEQPVLRGISTSIEEGEIVVLLGPSGCGKTTLLRIIAGLESAEQGTLSIEGADLEQIPIHRRRFGMVFQDYALFPHKNVRQNVAFGLRMSGWDQSRQERRVQQVLAMVGLAEFGQRTVHDLSGGEQQRVALARALAPYPRLLLLDEPLGSLDRALRERLMGELRSILKEASSTVASEATVEESTEPGGFQIEPDTLADSPATLMTSIYVTHDQEEAFAIADRVLVMNEGQIVQEGTPIELYRQPHSSFVARFLGMDNLLEAEIIGREPPLVRTIIGDLMLHDVVEPAGGQAMLLVRPEAATLVRESDEGPNVVEGHLTDISFRGRHQIGTLSVTSGKEPVALKLNFDSTVILPTVFTPIHIRLNPKRLRLLAR